MLEISKPKRPPPSKVSTSVAASLSTNIEHGCGLLTNGGEGTNEIDIIGLIHHLDGESERVLDTLSEAKFSPQEDIQSILFGELRKGEERFGEIMWRRMGLYTMELSLHLCEVHCAEQLVVVMLGTACRSRSPCAGGVDSIISLGLALRQLRPAGSGKCG